MSICGIYKITNLINNKCYIGQSVDIKTRWRHHKNNYNKENNQSYNFSFYRAIRKYGLENFKFEVLEECDQKDLNERELHWISYYDSYHNGYNETLGGDGKLQIDREEFKKYYYENYPSVKEAAEHFNISREVSGKIFKELGLQSLYYISKEKEKEICKYYLSDENFTLLDVSGKFNIDRETASKVLKRNGVNVRKITTNSLNRYKKILVYDLDGNFIREDLLFDFKKWIYENGYTKDRTGRCVAGCLRGSLWQANGFIVRWYKENYPTKIELSDYWDKDGVYQHKPKIVKECKPNIKTPSDVPILIYELKTGLFVKLSSFLKEVNTLIEQGDNEKKAKQKIWNILGGYKKSYNNYIYRHYKNDYPQKIDVTKNWKDYWWGKEKK